MKTPQLACQAKGLCRALPVHACWCTSSSRVAAVQCPRGTCPCKVTAHHLTSPPPWCALLRGKHRGPTSTTLHRGKPDTPNQLYSYCNILTYIPNPKLDSHQPRSLELDPKVHLDLRHTKDPLALHVHYGDIIHQFCTVIRQQ